MPRKLMGGSEYSFGSHRPGIRGRRRAPRPFFGFTRFCRVKNGWKMVGRKIYLSIEGYFSPNMAVEPVVKLIYKILRQAHDDMRAAEPPNYSRPAPETPATSLYYTTRSPQALFIKTLQIHAIVKTRSLS